MIINTLIAAASPEQTEERGIETKSEFSPVVAFLFFQAIFILAGAIHQAMQLGERLTATHHPDSESARKAAACGRRL